jgi:hypothetical protein
MANIQGGRAAGGSSQSRVRDCRTRPHCAWEVTEHPTLDLRGNVGLVSHVEPGISLRVVCGPVSNRHVDGIDHVVAGAVLCQRVYWLQLCT